MGTVTVTGSTYKAERATAYAAPVHPTANCAMGASIGIQGGIGFSASGTSVNETCETIEQAKATADLGDLEAAQEVLCTLPKIRTAKLRTGSPCWADRPENKPQTSAQEPTDPIVRQRMGLPAL